MRIAAVTMVYNEPVWLPVWLRHHSRLVGLENCLVLDHGSDDGSTAGLGVVVERVARTVLDEVERARVISDRVRDLLGSFDAVIHSDVDELLVPRGRLPSSMGGVVTAVGLDLQHLPDEEPVFDPALPLGEQRRWVRFSAAICKPVLVNEPVRWEAGFHGCNAASVFGDLYLVHLRYADLQAGLRRLGRTRRLAFSGPEVNQHQRVPDHEFETMMRAISGLPRLPGPLEPLVRPWMEAMVAGWARGDRQLSLYGDALWALPPNVLRQL